MVSRDGIPMGEDFTFGNAEADGFFSHYGDSTGDRSVNVLDLLPFRENYGSTLPFDFGSGSRSSGIQLKSATIAPTKTVTGTAKSLR